MNACRLIVGVVVPGKRRRPVTEFQNHHAVGEDLTLASRHLVTTRKEPAAVAGQGVVIGRLPLLQSLVDKKQLVAPFRSGGAATRRGYYVEVAAHAHDNPDALDFANWLRAEAERG